MGERLSYYGGSSVDVSVDKSDDSPLVTSVSACVIGASFAAAIVRESSARACPALMTPAATRRC